MNRARAFSFGDSGQPAMANEIAGVVIEMMNPEFTPLDLRYGIANQLLALGYRKAAAVTTVEELASLPVGSIVRSAAGRVAARWDETKFTQLGDERPFESWSNLALPCRVLLVGTGSHEVEQ